MLTPTLPAMEMDAAFLTLFSLLSYHIPPVTIGTTAFPTANLAKAILANAFRPMRMAEHLWEVLEPGVSELFVRQENEDDNEGSASSDEGNGLVGGYSMRPRESWDEVLRVMKRSKMRFVVRDWVSRWLLQFIIPIRAPVSVACGELEEADALYDRLIERDGYTSPMSEDGPASTIELVVASFIATESLSLPHTARLAEIFTDGPLELTEFCPSNSFLTTCTVARLLQSFSFALELVSSGELPHSASFKLRTHIAPHLQPDEITHPLKAGRPIIFGKAQAPEKDELMVYLLDEKIVPVPNAAIKLHLAVYNILQSSGVGSKLDMLLAEEEEVLYAGEALKARPDEEDDVLLFYLDRKMTIAASRDSKEADGELKGY